MIKRIKQWLYTRFLAVWLKESLLDDYRAALKEIEDLRKELAIKDAYITGLEAGIKSMRRIVINNSTVGEGKK